MIVKDELDVGSILNKAFVTYLKLYLSINAKGIKATTKNTRGSTRSPGRNSNSKNFQRKAGGLTPRQYSSILMTNPKLKASEGTIKGRIDV
jgi:hypothetical protein